MKQIMLCILGILLFSACKQQIKPEDISRINGYWEIEKVILPDGKTKDYKMNETVDYFKIERNAGFRKKVMPQFNGKYIDHGTAENIEVHFTDDKAWLFYNSGYAQWKEEIISVSNKELVLKNANNLVYHYKKPVPFSIK